MSSKIIIPPLWYQTFFTGLAVDFWDGATSDGWTAEEVSLLLSIFGKSSAFEKKLLDVLCGAGRHIPAMVAQGFSVVGVDISERMLSVAKEKTADLPVKFYQTDAMADLVAVLPDDERFDGAYCLGNSLGYGDANNVRQFLSAIVSLLKSGANLVLHSSMVAETVLPNWETRMEMVAGGVHAVIENLEYDPTSSRVITRFTFEKEHGPDAGKPSQETHTVCHYVFTTGEIIRWLESLGCEFVAAYGNTNQRPYALGDEQWYGVFQKR